MFALPPVEMATVFASPAESLEPAAATPRTRTVDTSPHTLRSHPRSQPQSPKNSSSTGKQQPEDKSESTQVHSCPIRRHLSEIINSHRQQSQSHPAEMRLPGSPAKLKSYWPNNNRTRKEKGQEEVSGTILLAVPHSGGAARVDARSASSPRDASVLGSMRKELPPIPAPAPAPAPHLRSSSLDAIMTSHNFPKKPNSPSQYGPFSPSSSSSPKVTGKRRKSQPAPQLSGPLNSHVVGVYKDGRITWDSKGKTAETKANKNNTIPLVNSVSHDLTQQIESPPPTRTCSEPRLHHAPPVRPRGVRPKIQVIIPRSTQPAHFIALPFRSTPQQSSFCRWISHQSAPQSSIEVSPASSNPNLNVRNSVVSPLASAQLAKPRRFFGRRAPTTVVEDRDEEELQEALSSRSSMGSLSSPSPGELIESSNTSKKSPLDDDASSYDDDRSSMTSLDSTSPSNRLEGFYEFRQSGLEALSLDSPVRAGVFDDSPTAASRSKSVHSRGFDKGQHSDSRPPTPPPKLQPIKRVSEVSLGFITGRRSPPSVHRSTSDCYKPKPLSRAGSRVGKPRSLPRNYRLQSKASAQLQPQAPPSPTLSMVEREIHDQLSSLTECDVTFKLDDSTTKSQSHDIQPALSSAAPPVPPRSKRRSSAMEGRYAVATSHIAAQVMRMKDKRSFSAPAHDVPPPKPADLVELPGDEKDLWEDNTLHIAELPAADKRKSQREEMMHAIEKLKIPGRQSGEIREMSGAEPRCDAERRLLQAITPEAAEQVIIMIFEALTSFEDLFATAQVNKGFYEVYKRNELRLLRNTLKQMSPPAWERREMTAPEEDPENSPDSAQPVPEYTPVTYLQCYKRESAVIGELKQLILTRCRYFLRPETKEALQGDDLAGVARVDNAFWRIWTFCRIFGCGRGREHDVIGQIDWLKGGVLAHEEVCTSTVVGRDSIEGSDVLLSAPECFGQGNPCGLSAEQLYDMTELWTCLGVLIQGFEGRTEHARGHGVYDVTDIRGGDIDGEEHMLEEWYYYLLTLGLDTVAELAGSSASAEPTAFVLANAKGWMDWTPPTEGQSRATFLKDAVSRVYEEKIASVCATDRPRRQELRKITRERIQGHAAEIKLRKRARDLRVIRMSMERPMSEWENVMHVLDHSSLPSLPSQSGGHPRVASGSSASDSFGSLLNGAGIVEEEESQHPPRLQSPQSLSSSVTAPTQSHHDRDRGSIAPSSTFLGVSCNASRESLASTHSQRSRASNQHPLQTSIADSSDPAQNSAEKAIFRIVEMGFTAEDAKHALRVTDMGDGLRVDRAVELLLRRQS